MRTFAAAVLMLASLSLSALAFAAPVQHAKPVTKSTSTPAAKTARHAKHHHRTHARHHVAKKSVTKK